jgi:hypothetical protein
MEEIKLSKDYRTAFTQAKETLDINGMAEAFEGLATEIGLPGGDPEKANAALEKASADLGKAAAELRNANNNQPASVLNKNLRVIGAAR